MDCYCRTRTAIFSFACLFCASDSFHDNEKEENVRLFSLFASLLISLYARLRMAAVLQLWNCLVPP